MRLVVNLLLKSYSFYLNFIFYHLQNGMWRNVLIAKELWKRKMVKLRRDLNINLINALHAEMK